MSILEIGLSILVWVAIALILVKFWRNILNLIGGFVYLVAVLLVIVFILVNFTNFNVDEYVDLTFYDKVRQGDTEYLIEQRDIFLGHARDAVDVINSLDGDSTTNHVDTESYEAIESPIFPIIMPVELSDIDMGYVQAAEKPVENSDTKTLDVVKYEGDTTTVKYREVEQFLNGVSMREDTQQLVRHLSPHIEWQYGDGEWLIHSHRGGIDFTRQ